jgi:hypothetical protein
VGVAAWLPLPGVAPLPGVDPLASLVGADEAHPARVTHSSSAHAASAQNDRDDGCAE